MSGQQDVQERGSRFTDDQARARLLAGIPVTERRLDVGGVSTAVLETGDGPTMVLLHGGIEECPVCKPGIVALGRSEVEPDRRHQEPQRQAVGPDAWCPIEHERPQEIAVPRCEARCQAAVQGVREERRLLVARQSE